MQKQVISILVVGISAGLLGGCGSDADHRTTPQELKAFKGGPMPPEARKKFEESMRVNAKRTAEAMAKRMGGGNAPSSGSQ
ncbi:MAG: hypothetical protein P4L46_09740 [Fimbriimonas sp.]|nr:hypothetical protein [Fimbriimonas sp.]